MAMYCKPRRCRGDHFFQRAVAVSLGGVHVQVAYQVAQFDQTGQRAGRGQGELETRLANLGRKAGISTPRRLRPRFCRRCTVRPLR